MAQEIINYGNTANDGTGDPLRDAFIKVDDNFTQIWAAGPVGSNITIQNNTIAVVNTNGNLILTPNGVGVIQTNSKLVPRLDNTYDLGSANLRYRSIFVGAGGITTSGNLTLGNISDLKIPGGDNGYVIQTDGTGNLSWTAQTGSGNGNPGGANTQVQFNDDGLFGGNTTFTFNKTTGNLNVPIITVGNRIVSDLGRFENYLFANAFQVGLGNTDTWDISGNIFSAPTGATWFSNVVAGDDYISSATDGYLNFQTFDVSSNVATELQMEHGLVNINIYNGDLVTWEFNESGNLILPNITNPSINYANGEPYVSTGGGGVIQSNTAPASPTSSTLWWDEVSGRLYVYYTDADGSQWVDASPAAAGPTYGNANVSSFLASGNNSSDVVTTGGVVAASVETSTITSGDSTLVVVNDGLQVGGDIVISGDIIPDTGNVYSLGSATNQWADLYVANATIYMNNVPISLGAGNVLTVNGEPVLSNDSDSSITTTGNITANYFIGNGSQLTGLPESYGNADVATFLAEYGSNTISTTGNITGGNLITSGRVSASGNILGLNFATEGSVQASSVQATGNVSAGLYGQLGYNSDLGAWGLEATEGFYNVSLTAGDATKYTALLNNDGVFYLPETAAANVARLSSEINNADVDLVLVGGKDVRIESDGTNTNKTWTFDSAGDLTAPGNITTPGGYLRLNNDLFTWGLEAGPDSLGAVDLTSATFDEAGNITAQYTVSVVNDGRLILPESSEANVAKLTSPPNDANVSLQLYSGNAVRIVSNSSGEPFVWTFGTTGAFTAPGNVTATGNISGGNILGNGASMTGVATKVTDSWTVTTGTNNYSFTVPDNGVYQLWINGNIPNGIITYIATVSVTNSNVPVIGQQFAWNYEGAGNPILLTSIPDQIIGTAGAISNANPTVGTTSNTFVFGINNSSGGNVTVNYGYTKLS